MRAIQTGLLALSTFFVCASAIQAEDSAALMDRLHRAKGLSSLDDPSTTITVNFQFGPG